MIEHDVCAYLNQNKRNLMHSQNDLRVIASKLHNYLTNTSSKAIKNCISDPIKYLGMKRSIIKNI